MSTRREQVAVLLSGGVDSAVALALLRDAGHQVTAYYLKIWLEEELAFLGTCPWEEDLAYARAVCRALEVPLEVVPFQAEYQQAVVEYVLGALRAGHTPSPDVLCNRAIKFGAFVEQVAGAADAVASGHYARLETVGGRVGGRGCAAGSIRSRTRATSSPTCSPSSWRACAFPSASCTSTRCAPWLRRARWRRAGGPTARGSASWAS